MISGKGVKQGQNSECGVPNENREGPGPVGEVIFSASLRLLTKDELAAALRVSPRTVQEMVSGQEILIVRIRGAVRFYLPDVVRSLTANAVTSKRGCAHRLAGEVIRRWALSTTSSLKNCSRAVRRSQMQRDVASVACHPGGTNANRHASARPRWSWLWASEEIHVGTTVRDLKIDNGPPLFGELIYLCEGVGLTVFPLR